MAFFKNLYFYDSRRLAHALRDGQITESDALKHMIVSMVILGVGFELPLSLETEEDTRGLAHALFGLVVFIANVAITYFGTWLTFQCNSKGDAKDFFLRFTALTLPICIQLLVVLLIIAVGLFVLLSATTNALGVASFYLFIVLVSVLEIAALTAYFIKMRNCMRIASGQPS